MRGGEQVEDDLAEAAERQGADRRPAGEGPCPLWRPGCQPCAERVRAVCLDADGVVMTASGLESAVSGPGPGPGVLLVSGSLTAFYLFAWAAIAWQTQNEVKPLIRELSEILGATNSPW